MQRVIGLLDGLGGEGRILDYMETRRSCHIVALWVIHFSGREVYNTCPLSTRRVEAGGEWMRLADRIEDMFTQVIWVGESPSSRPAQSAVFQDKLTFLWGLAFCSPRQKEFSTPFATNL